MVRERMTETKKMDRPLKTRYHVDTVQAGTPMAAT